MQQNTYLVKLSTVLDLIHKFDNKLRFEGGDIEDEVQNLISEIEDIQSMGDEWIKCSDKMPVPIDKGYCKNITVLCHWEGGGVSEFDYETVTIRGKEVSRFIWKGKLATWKITHWQPLPLPPNK